MTEQTSSPPPKHVVTWIVVIALGVPTAIAILLSIVGSNDGSWSLTGALTTLTLVSLVVSRTSINSTANILLVVCTFSVVLLWPEMGLRALGYSANRAGTVVFGLVEPSGTIPALHDPDLFWTLSPEQPGINTDGFPDNEFVIPKPEGEYRIVFLGDSCTQQGFPKNVEQILSQTPSDAHRYKSVNLGIAGYTSHQGLVVAKRWLTKLEPDMVVVYFGWNDHWRAVVATDSERSLWYRRMLVQLISSSRLFQVGVWAYGPKPLERINQPRVSLAEYRENLDEIGALVRSVNADVLFLTAPSSHEHRGVPDYLVDQGFASSKEAVTSLHAEYNLVVTDLTRERNWRLLDLGSEVQERPGLSRFFLKDGIHYSEQGLPWIAGRIAKEVEAVDGQAESVE